jgi:hypothetical protein
MGQWGTRFDWKEGILDHMQERQIQSEYFEEGATQDRVARRFGTNKRALGHYLKRSRADWRPDPIQERAEKLQYECWLNEARQRIASLMEENESLRFSINNCGQ